MKLIKILLSLHSIRLIFISALVLVFILTTATSSSDLKAKPGGINPKAKNVGVAIPTEIIVKSKLDESSDLGFGFSRVTSLCIAPLHYKSLLEELDYAEICPTT